MRRFTLLLPLLCLAGCFVNGNSQIQGEAKDNGNGNASGNAANPVARGAADAPGASGSTAQSPPPSATSSPESLADASTPAASPAYTQAQAECGVTIDPQIVDTYGSGDELMSRLEGKWFLCAGGSGPVGGIEFHQSQFRWLSISAAGDGVIGDGALAPATLASPFVPPDPIRFDDAASITLGGSIPQKIVAIFYNDSKHLTIHDAAGAILWVAVPYGR